MTAISAPFNVEFDPTDHSYTVDGQDYPSITQVLKAAGLSGSPFWKESDRRRGTAVHKVALLIGSRPIRGKTVEEVVYNSPWEPTGTAPILVPYGMACARWYLESGVQPIIVEAPVASKRMRVAGTFDGYGAYANKNNPVGAAGATLLYDFKSGEPEEASHLQTAGYCALAEESRGISPNLRTVVWLKRDGTYKAFPPRPPGGADLAVMQAAITVYHWRKANTRLDKTDCPPGGQRGAF